ncbi:zinc finger an1-type domain 2a [Anaeramoeba ignava]|uniref:Zinc finger an1-type domain 2a n=1 Tax=Anaeramoeba ignava TaxID=1746090 RepID=A0A9Q0R6T5_ANAIG|nr:zinc finger an1-type domain 2a [Anaeramoeba ignava]
MTTTKEEEYDELGWGVNCSFSECKRLDFLPIKCELCGKSFCSDHSNPEKHNCPKFEKKIDRVVPSCPICGKVVIVKPNEDVNNIVNQHIESGCKTHLSKIGHKFRCTFPGCGKREPFEARCSKCGKNFCLNHRNPLHHNCNSKKK